MLPQFSWRINRRDGFSIGEDRATDRIARQDSARPGALASAAALCVPPEAAPVGLLRHGMPAGRMEWASRRYRAGQRHAMRLVCLQLATDLRE
jgi:hypothetical protein